MKKLDLTGQKFGRLIVLRQEGKIRDCLLWACLCECGTARSVTTTSLRHGNTRSCGCLRRGPAGAAARHGAFCLYRKNARDRNIEFVISESEAITIFEMNCHYCGSPPSNAYRTRTGTFIYNGIDRIDNAIGYRPANVVPCCRICNRMKFRMGRENFLAHILRIARLHPAAT